jgi:FkbM family methyltransferase
VDEECEEERNGLRWVLNPSDYAHEDIFWLGELNRYEIYHILRLVPPDAVIFDIGANIGYYSLTLAHQLGSRASFYSFEPNPPTLARFQRHIELNHLSNIHLQNVGLADHEGSAHVVERSDNSGAATLREGGSIQLVTLDGFVERHGVERIDFMKVDIEGFEQKMLAGARRTLARLRPIIQIELNPPALAKAGSSVPAVVEELRQAGYQLFEVNRRRLEPLRALPSGEDFVNAWCVHPGNQPPHWAAGTKR